MQDDENGEGEPEGQDDPEGAPPPTPPTPMELDRWWHAYCRMAPPRPWSRLRNIVGGQKARLRKAVHEGWPELGILAFKDREVAGDEAVAEIVSRATTAAVERVGAVVAESWTRAAEDHLRHLPAFNAAIGKLVRHLEAASEHISFVKYRRVPDLDASGAQRRDAAGQPLMVIKPYVDATDVALAAQRLAAAKKDHAILHKALLDSLAPFRDAGIDFSDAPPEVLAYLNKKWTGRAA